MVFDGNGRYLGLVPLEDVHKVMLTPESIPLLLTGDILRSDVAPLTLADTLETAFESFSRYEVDLLPVFSSSPGTKATLQGVLLRTQVLRRYQAELEG